MADSQEVDVPDGVKDGTYGVQSLEEAMDERTINSPEMIQAGGPRESMHNHQSPQDHPTVRRMSTVRPARPRDLDFEVPSQSSSRPSRSRASLSPLILSSPAEPISFPSSPKSISTRSFRPSEEISLPDDNPEDPSDHEERQPLHQSQTQIEDSVPQLIMPSIRMPSRRPFTERGKAMGRLKVMVAGAPGSGKTSLIKAIVQASEHIVHVDPLQDAQKTIQRERKRRNSRQQKDELCISEVYASTKPYPAWWSDMDDSRVLRRRKSLGDVVLERNLCFVDTGGGKKSSRAEQTENLVQYMVHQLLRSLGAIHAVNSDLQGLLGGNGGSQVDTILYLISKDTMTPDIECIRRLSQFSNVIPLISKADTLSEEEIASLKLSFIDSASEASIKPFLFGGALVDHGGPEGSHAPFAVSSASTSDSETMDASILMSPDYVQPLASSELGSLLEMLFDQDNLAWLRHSAAKKLIQSHHIQPSNTHSAGSSLSSSQSSHFTFPPKPLSRSNTVNPPGYALARVTDYTQREEQLAQVRLAKWSTDLQRSLQNERERYEALARDERAVWLTERLGECVVDGTLVPLAETPGFSGFQSLRGNDNVFTFEGREGRCVKYRVANRGHHDPLGLIQWNDELKRRGWILVQVVGSVGVVGGLALWVARVWGLTQNTSEWSLGWLSGHH